MGKGKDEWGEAVVQGGVNKACTGVTKYLKIVPVQYFLYCNVSFVLISQDFNLIIPVSRD